MEKEASSTLRTSRAVTHPGTIRALRSLTSEFGWDPVHSTQYGRWRNAHLLLRYHSLYVETIIFNILGCVVR